MAKRKEGIIGLDIGSTKVATVVGVKGEGDKFFHIVGSGHSPCRGVKKDIIVDVEDTISCISTSLEEAERISGLPIDHVYLGIGGARISSLNSRGAIAVSRADSEITTEDVNRVIEAAQAVSIPANFEIIHVIPRSYTIDGQEGISDPVGMTGVRLEVETHIIFGSSPIIKNLTKCVYQAGADIDELVFVPLASAYGVLSDRQKELGVCIIDIGGEVTHIAVFEEGNVLHTAILPIGSGHITNDIAIGLRTSIDVAEKVKKEYGFAQPKEINKKDMINLSQIDASEKEKVSKKEVAEIIEARLSEIFSLINQELKKIGRKGSLPAGIVLVGGGAKLPGIVDVAKDNLNLPAQIGFPKELKGIVDKLDDPSYATSIGLMLWGMQSISERKGFIGNFPQVESLMKKIKKWTKSFLP